VPGVGGDFSDAAPRTDLVTGDLAAGFLSSFPLDDDVDEVRPMMILFQVCQRKENLPKKERKKTEKSICEHTPQRISKKKVILAGISYERNKR
jgi:hypothetical protein